MLIGSLGDEFNHLGDACLHADPLFPCGMNNTGPRIIDEQALAVTVETCGGVVGLDLVPAHLHLRQHVAVI